MIPIGERAHGRWKSILPLVGIPASFLTGKNGPCPLCQAGKDRWRWTNYQDDGLWICNNCGAGNGVDFVMRYRNVDFKGAVRLIEEVIGQSHEDRKPVRSDKSVRDGMERLWSKGVSVTADCVVGQYLASRSIVLERYPGALRYCPSVRYEAESATTYPAMLAKVISAEGKAVQVHRTFFGPDGIERKKLMPGTLPDGAAIRLSPVASVMGVAEGIETALSASIMFDMPVWALINSGNLAKFVPPSEVEELHIFADQDPNFDGQAHAYHLAHKVYRPERKIVMHIPDIGQGDWNNVLQARKSL